MGQEARGGQEPSPREPRKGGSQSPALTLRTLPGVLGASPRRLLGVRGALPYSISVSVCFLFLSCCVKVRSKSRKSQDGKRPEMGQKQCQEWSVQAPYPGLPLQPPPPPAPGRDPGLLTPPSPSPTVLAHPFLLGSLLLQAVRLPLLRHVLHELLPVYHKRLRVLPFPRFYPCLQLLFQLEP